MTKLLEAISVLALVAMYAMSAVHWGELPERYPAHFNASGVPDKWGAKHGTLVLPVIATGMFLLLTFVARNARQYNVPFPVDQQAPEVRAEMRQFITAVKTVVTMMFAYVHGRSIAVATGHADGLGRAFLPIFLAVTFGVIAIYLTRLRRFRLNTGFPH